VIKLKYYLSALHNTDVLQLLTGKVNKNVKYLDFKGKKSTTVFRCVLSGENAKVSTLWTNARSISDAE
jgi:hypothetical protein